MAGKNLGDDIPPVEDAEQFANFPGTVVRYDLVGGTINQIVKNETTGVERIVWTITLEPWAAETVANQLNDRIKERDRWINRFERAIVAGEKATDLTTTAVGLAEFAMGHQDDAARQKPNTDVLN